jgi:hypothetical protein
MSYPGANQSRLAYLEPSHATSERSAFIYGVEYCNHFMPESAEIKVLTPQPHSMRVSIFHMGTEGCAFLGQALGIDSKTWTRALGRDIVGAQQLRAVLLGELRYCRECLKQGWHSALCQPVAVERCPVHRIRLQTGCPHCGASIPTSMIAIGRNHFHCPDCGKSLATERRRTGLGKPVLQIGAASFATLRASLLDTGASDLIRSPLKIEQSPEEVVRSTSGSRALAHHLLWSEAGTEARGASSGATDSLLSVGHDDALVPAAQVQRRLRATALAAVEELLETVQRAGATVVIPDEVCTIGSAAARIDVSMGLVAAALWRTAHVFDVSRFVLGELPPPQAPAQPFSDGIPPFQGIDDAIRRAQVFGVFVDSILQLRRCRYGVEIEWNRTNGQSALLPAWRGAVNAGRVELRLRSRCNDRLVARLTRRHAARRLEHVPEGASVQALVNAKG